MTYSLWLTPQGPAAARLQTLIERLSLALHSPRFAPHVTLLGGIDGAEGALLRQAARLAAGLAPLAVSLTRIDWEEAFYRCLYIRVAPTPELCHAHRRARGVFTQAHAKVFRPHLSLVYGELSQARKAVLARRLDRHYPERLEVAHLALYATGGPPHRWRCIGSFEMGG